MPVSDDLSAIRKGMLEFVILKIIAAEEVYVADILAQLARTEFATREGTLYPRLSKMRQKKLLDWEWRDCATGPPRKYYKLTAAGRVQLKVLDEYWKQINESIEMIGSKT